MPQLPTAPAASEQQEATGDDSDSTEQVSNITKPAHGISYARLLLNGLSWLPSLLVIVMLASVAWYGHKNDWKIPELSSASATTEVAWCDSHGVPEEDCIVCRPSLIEDMPLLSFCKLHGVHGCVLCNPAVAQTKQPTEPTADDLARFERALALRPRIENLAIVSSPGARIQFASIAAMNKAGVDVEPVERRRVIEAISAAGEIRYNANKTGYVAPQADGIVRQILVQVGAWVKKGQVLAVVDSTEAGTLKTELLAALDHERLRMETVRRLRPLAGEAVAGKRLLESENDLLQARSIVDRTVGALGNLGLTINLATLRKLQSDDAIVYVQRIGRISAISDTDSLDENNMNLIAVVAPLDGEIVHHTTTVGQVVDRGSQLFRIVDTRNVWLDLRVSAEEASLVNLGQHAEFVPDGQSQRHTGKVSWISSEVDPQTRTVRVRAVLANAERNLRNESFGRGQIILRDDSDSITVPDSSVQWDGAGQVVFVRDARFFDKGRPKFFVSRSVRTGVTQHGFVEIIAGVLPGEVVAANGSDVLRAQLLRSNLGAGCTCGR